MDSINLTIDELQVTAPKGTMILDAARQSAIYIPHLCSHPDLAPIEQMKPSPTVYQGNKRLENKMNDLQYEGCQLCMVEIDGQEGFQRACNTSVAEGMIVHTTSPEIDAHRRDRIMFLLGKHPHACLTCAQKEGCARFPCSTNIPEIERCCAEFGHCEFQKVAEYVGIKPETPRYVFEDLTQIKEDPLFDRNYNLCIGCSRCVRMCRDVIGAEVLDFIFDEDHRILVGTVKPSLPDSACRFCTSCVEVCPTGALTDKKTYDTPPCQDACPAGVDVPRYVRLAAEEKFDESYAVVRERLPLPSVCSYICFSYCEDECRRGELNEPVGIRGLKRFVSENHGDLWKQNLKHPIPTGKKAAIIGSGPAGLTAAYYLARKGHAVTVFEQASTPGGMLRQAILRQRLPEKALEEDIEEILGAGVHLELNAPEKNVNELFEEGYDAVFIATGSTFIGLPAYVRREEAYEVTPCGSIKVDSTTLAASRQGVFAGGDAVLGGISQDFIRRANEETGFHFFDKLVEQLSVHRGDSSRSAVHAIASGRKAAEAIDKYLGGDGDIGESLLTRDEIKRRLGREEGFADLRRLSPPVKMLSPQFAGLSEADSPLNRKEALMEARRCLRCDLRLLFGKPFYPPKIKSWFDFNPENVTAVPEVEGIFQLLDEQEKVIYIKGSMNLRKEIEEQLEINENARFFMYEQDEMFTKKESELLQQYIAEHGEMPEGNRELDDLF